MTNLKINLKETIKIRESLGIKHKRKGIKRFLSHIVQRWKQSVNPKLEEGVYEERIVDRGKNEYHQVVKDAKTGEIIHEEHHPLSQHKPKK